MCTRYYIEQDSPELAPLLHEVTTGLVARQFLHSQAKPILTSGEISPTSIAPTIATSRNGKKMVYPMQWGFQVRLPGRHAYHLPIIRNVFNARSETAGETKLFAEEWASHRCIVPASWYYEWEHTIDASGKRVVGQRYAIQPRTKETLWMCGLYKMVNSLPHFVILTREPTVELSGLHDRMPLILPEASVDEWIDPGSNPWLVAKNAMTDLICWK